MRALDTQLNTITAAGNDSPTVAFFDLDRTLIAGYSILSISRETAEQGARRGKLSEAIKVVQDILKHKVYSSGANYHRIDRVVLVRWNGYGSQHADDIDQYQ